MWNRILHQVIDIVLKSRSPSGSRAPVRCRHPHERAKNFDAGFVALARSVYRTNDERSAVKRAINELSKIKPPDPNADKNKERR